MQLKLKSITIFVKCSDYEMTIIQVSSFNNQRFGVLSTRPTQRIDYFWALG